MSDAKLKEVWDEFSIGPWEQEFFVVSDPIVKPPEGCVAVYDAELTLICYVEKDNADLLIQMLVEGHAAMWARRCAELNKEDGIG